MTSARRMLTLRSAGETYARMSVTSLRLCDMTTHRGCPNCSLVADALQRDCNERT